MLCLEFQIVGMKPSKHTLNFIAGVGYLRGGIELLLDGTNVDESGQQVRAAGLVVGTRSTGTTKGLLTNYGTSALAVDVEVTSSVAQLVLSKVDSLTVAGKDGAGETVLGGGVDEFAGLAKGIGCGVIVDVCGQDGTKEFSRQELVSGVGGLVNGWVNEVALGGVVFAASDELEFLVGLGLVDGTGQLLEGGSMDNGAAKVGVVPRLTDTNLFGLCGELLFKLGPNGLGNIYTRSSTALLTLELKGTTNSVLDGVVDVGRGMNQVEVLATSLTYDSGV